MSDTNPTSNAAYNPWLAIDFGTCNTAAAIEIDGRAHLVSQGTNRHFPTIACVFDPDSIEVCHDAEPLRTQFPESFLQEFKLQIADPIDLNGAQYPDVVAAILRYVKACAEIENNDRPLSKALLTVPALYTQADPRKAVMEAAARKAGFIELQFMPEPEAAARHYADIMGAAPSGLSLIYDLGGGTFDPALLEAAPGKAPAILGHESGVKCGGHFFDRAIYNHFADLCRSTETPLKRSGRLADYAACRRIKESLSVKNTASQMFSNGQKLSMSRTEFHQLIAPLIELTLQACDNLLASASRSWTQVGRVLFVGGSTAIPLIREMLQTHILSHNAPKVEIVRNLTGKKGEYNHTFATALGAMAAKILPPAPKPEPVGLLTCGSKSLKLKLGNNTFGRGADSDFRFDDPKMSRLHFSIMVTRGADNRLSYNITTCSNSKATIINNMEALDLRYAPISRISAPLLDGYTITAGHTVFQFKKSTADAAD